MSNARKHGANRAKNHLSVVKTAPPCGERITALQNPESERAVIATLARMTVADARKAIADHGIHTDLFANSVRREVFEVFTVICADKAGSNESLADLFRSFSGGVK